MARACGCVCGAWRAFICHWPNAALCLLIRSMHVPYIFCTIRIASVYSGWNYVIAPMRVCVRRTEPHTWCRRNAMWWFSNILNGDAWARANMDNRLKCAYEKVCHWTHLDRKCRRNKIFFRCSNWPPKQKQLKQLALEESTKQNKTFEYSLLVRGICTTVIYVFVKRTDICD